MGKEDHLLSNVTESLAEIKPEITRLQEIASALSPQNQKIIQEAAKVLVLPDESEQILKQKIEVCLPIIPYFIKWKAEIDLNVGGAKTAELINFISSATCEKVINAGFRLRKYLGRQTFTE